MFSERIRVRQGLLLILDGASLCAAFVLALGVRGIHDWIPFIRLIPSTLWRTDAVSRSEYALVLFATVLSVLAYVRLSRIYLQPSTPGVIPSAMVYFRGILLSALITSVLVFTLKINISRLFFAYFFILSILSLVAKQWAFTRFVVSKQRAHVERKAALILGNDLAAAWLGGIIQSSNASPYRLLGVLTEGSGTECLRSGISVLGQPHELGHVLDHHDVDAVFVVGSSRDIAQWIPIAQIALERGKIVSLASTMTSSDHGLAGRITEYHGIPMISYGPMPKDGIRSSLTRGMDVLAGVAGMIMLSPVLFCIAAAVKATSRGPAVFSQERLGLEGKRFRVYKFRSMVIDAESRLRRDPELYETYRRNDYKLPEERDPRLTRLGRFLRKTSLDELPQIWNVIRGDMTLVGPRPIVPQEVERYHPYADVLLSVKPGLTGPWQVSGRSDLPYPARAFVTLDYVARQNVLGDLQILARTLPAVVRRRGAY